jgi:hypothetical protein
METETSGTGPGLELGPSREEVETLKAQWNEDPCWDIEETEGFEAVRDELRVWRRYREYEQARTRARRRLERALELRCSPALVGYVETLESRMADLETRLAEADEETARLRARLSAVEGDPS